MSNYETLNEDVKLDINNTNKLRLVLRSINNENTIYIIDKSNIITTHEMRADVLTLI
jgi:hypothetical protein